MADPICRWRNPSIDTVRELINLLPKQELEKSIARAIIIENNPFNADFFKTPYQLASQLGLYYVLGNRYFPKFNYNPTDQEISLYLQNWITHYSIPNPYTKSLGDFEPFSIHSRFCLKIYEERQPINYVQFLTELLGDDIGNVDILKNALNFSPVITINNDFVILKDGIEFDDLVKYINIDILSDRNDKEYFFDLFQVPSRNDEIIINDSLIREINPQEINILNEVQNLPNLSQTQKNQIVAARIGQGFFRRTLILECGYCPISQVDETALLIASHIKPWRDSNNIERINPKNGILLTPTYDKLFDKGYISFTDDKRILVSDILSDENKHRLNISNNTLYPTLPVNGREEFLNYHRNNIFKG